MKLHYLVLLLCLLTGCMDACADSVVVVGGNWFAGGVSCSYASQQSNSSENTTVNLFRNANSIDSAAQSFSNGSGFTVCRTTMEAKRVGSRVGETVHVEIWTDSAGLPNAQTGGDSDTVGFDSIGTGASETVTFDWSSSHPVLSGSTTYHIVYVLDGTTDNGNYWVADVSDGNPYGSGLMSTYDKDDVEWTTADYGVTYDFVFDITN